MLYLARFVHTDRNEVRQFLSKTQVKLNRQNDSRQNGWFMSEEKNTYFK